MDRWKDRRIERQDEQTDPILPNPYNQGWGPKNAYELLVFFNWVPYMQPSHMIPGVNIISRKVSVSSVNGTGGSGGVLRP